MNGNNTQTKQGFINALGHPRKKQLATILLGDNATVEAAAEAGFDRISTLEMARNIKQSVEGMKDFSFDWPRDNEVKVATPAATEETVDSANADQSTVATDENQNAPVATDDTAVKTEEATNDSAPVSSENVPTPTADQIQVETPTEPAAPVAPNTDTPAQPQG